MKLRCGLKGIKKRVASSDSLFFVMFFEVQFVYF